jgi:hypothetical protein
MAVSGSDVFRNQGCRRYGLPDDSAGARATTNARGNKANEARLTANGRSFTAFWILPASIGSPVRPAFAIAISE